MANLLEQQKYFHELVIPAAKAVMRTHDAARGCDQVFIDFDCPCGSEGHLDFVQPHGVPVDAQTIELAVAEHVEYDIRIGRLHG